MTDSARHATVPAEGAAITVSLAAGQTATGANFGLSPRFLTAIIKDGAEAQADEGGSHLFDGTLSTDVGGSIVSYQWDFNYDGYNFSADATGSSATMDLSTVDGPWSQMVALRITDSRGLSSIATTLLEVTDVPPTATFTGGTVLLGGYGSITFSNQFDPSPADMQGDLRYYYDLDDDGFYDIRDTLSPNWIVAPRFLATPGPHTIDGAIVDKDGYASFYTTTINVLLPVSVTGTVYGDSNSNGARDPGEPGVPGVSLFLDSDGDRIDDPGEPFATTDANGAYSFTSVFPGNYAVLPILPVGWKQTDDTSEMFFNLGSDVKLSGLDVGLQSPPLPNLGGPYSVAEGASLTLDASASSEVGGAITSYEWDTNYNGTTFVARATGVSIPFSAVGLDGPSTRNIALRITDSHGATDISAGSVAITNTAPTAIFTSGGSVTQGNSGSVSFTNSTDPSPADVTAGFKYSYDFNNDGTFDTVDSSTTSATVASSYLSTTGSHTIKGRIKDKDGGFTDFTTTIQVNAPITGTITGTVYNDANGNGIKDSGEASVSGQKMFLDLNRDAVLQSTEPTFTTGPNGVFTFSGLAAGTYRVRMIQLSGYTWTAPTSGYYEVAAAAGQDVTTKDYLEKKTTALTASPLAASPTKAQPKATISGMVFQDANANGKHDSKESGLSAWIVYIDSNNNGKLDHGEQRFTTGADGEYKFTVNAGSYLIREVLNKGFVRTATSANGLRIQAGRGQTIGGKDFADR